MRKLIFIFLLIPFISNGQINLKTGAKWSGGTGKTILMTNGTAIDTVKPISSDTWLHWDGSDFTFNPISSVGITSLNGLTGSLQTFEVNTSGTDFTISSSGTKHRFNIPDASQLNRGFLIPSDWISFNAKKGSSDSTNSITGYTTLYKNSLKLNISDTTAMLSKYLRKQDSTATYFSYYQGNLKLAKSDTSAMLSYYLKKQSLAVNAPLSYNSTTTTLSVDTTSSTGLQTRYQATLKLNISDTTAMLDHYIDSVQISGMFKPLWSKSTVDQSFTSTSNTALTNISIPIAANQTIYFKAVLKIGCTGTNGYNNAVTIPSGATMLVSVIGTQSATSAAGAPKWLTSSGTQSASLGGVAATTNISVIEGWVTTGATSGTIDIQGASVNIANTVTIYAGSYITGHKQ